jgi:serine protease Do
MEMKTARLFQWFAVLTIAAAAPLSAASPGIAKAFSSEVADTVEEVMPSVVVIRTEAVRYQLAKDFFFGNVYRIPEKLAGHGSGVIISPDGYALTSAHVVQGAEEVEAVLDTGEKLPARLIGIDAATDLAVVKIEGGEGRTFTALPPGDSDALRVGEFVIALGSPFSLSGSVTMGIVSQKGRSVGLLPYEDFIQTDASINPGNSGGPLVNLDGELVGINAVIQTGSPHVRGNIGIGFAVPVNLASRVAEALIEEGTFTRPWIGISTMPARVGESLEGVRIAEVYGGTPADRAGLRPNDVIIRVGAEAVDTIRDLQRGVMNLKEGEMLEIRVRRGGEEVVVQSGVEPMPTIDALR